MAAITQRCSNCRLPAIDEESVNSEMATVQQYPLINWRPILPPPRLEVVPKPDEVTAEPHSTDQEAERPDFNEAVREVLRWESVKRGNPGEFLCTLWEVASKQIGDSAEQLRQVIATGKVLQGEARVFSDNLTLIRSALTESHAGIEAAHELPRVQRADCDRTVPRAFALAAAYLNSAQYVFDERDFALFLASVQK